MKSIHAATSRIFLVGNGMSLNWTPVSELHPKMGVNKIGALTDVEYYVKVDNTEFDGGEWKSEVMPFVEAGRPCLLWAGFRDEIGDRPNVTYVTRCKHHNVPEGHKDASPGWHEPFCTAWNSINIMAQWAVKLGFTEIVLVGCDLDFTDGKTDHFMPYYTKVDHGYRRRNNANVMAAHRLIARECPVPVYNGTIGGSLEVFPRVAVAALV